MENNRFEEVPQKENGFVKAMKFLGRYFKNVFGSFIDGFKYNDMKLASLLVALPGLLIGFFLVAHANTINQMTFEFTCWNEEAEAYYDYAFPGMPFDATGIAVFVLMLFGILNVFNALNMSNKKNLGSVVIATVFTVIMLAVTAYYVYAVLYYKSFTYPSLEAAKAVENPGIYINTAKSTDGYVDVIDKQVYLVNPTLSAFTKNYMISIVSIIVCDVLSVAGIILGFIKYDRTYEKVDR